MVEFSRILKKIKKDEESAHSEKEPVLSAPIFEIKQLKESGEPQELKIEKKEGAAGAESPEKATFEKPQPQEKTQMEEKPVEKVIIDEPAKAHAEETSVCCVGVKDSFPLYEHMLVLAREIFQRDIDFEKVHTEKIVEAVTESAGLIVEGDQKIVELALTYTIEGSEYYLFQHSVNACIISLLIGVGLDFEIKRLIELGLAAFLHDIGMVCYEDMVQLPRKLTQKEYEEIKKHVDAGDRILNKIDHGLGEAIRSVQYEIHERLDGSGYPKGKKIILDHARIIALADAFESMTHPRPFRPRYSIMDAYKRILDAKNQYDQHFIKVLIDKVGFFPNGSFVQLNTKETGRVIKQNSGAPLRPIVKIIYGADGTWLAEEEAKIVNLAKHPTLHVKGCFLEDAKKC